ncbi:MAG: tetratricopeptide (TPR) repeat protein [Patiriisocius sp.]|jgi:tetratricopeptide (TPR) repeat protein
MRLLYFTFLFLITSSVFSQSEILARNYFDRGDYKKAIAMYETLYAKNPYKNDYMMYLVEAHQQLENFEASRQLLEKQLNKRNPQKQFLVDLGHNYSLQQKDSVASFYYTKALAFIKEKPNYASVIAKKFEKHNLLDQAVLAYEKGMELTPSANYNIQLARIYGEQGALENMFLKYINAVKLQERFKPTAQRNFSLYTTEDPKNHANILLRSVLLKKLQEGPDILYNELLSWLFIQQKEFSKAFTQEKAIYKRMGDGNMKAIIDLAVIALSEEAYESATDIINFVIEKSASPNAKLQGHQYLMKIRMATATKDDYKDITKEFERLLKRYGNDTATYLLQIDYNHFLAFKVNDIETATSNLKKLTERRLNIYQESRVKMELADILVFDEKFNRALIYYTQIQKKVKSDVLAQEARFKVARTSYFKGDFVWAKAQVDVLRKSTTQLIANDALKMTLLIHDNTLEDSLQTALKKYAHADLLALQNKDEEAIAALSEILTNHKGEKIEDEALLKQGELYEKTKQFKKAEANYLALIQLYKDEILADDAIYKLAKLYENELQDPQKAKDYYEQILFDFADSIYFVEARKKYRMLRGDEIEY